MYGASVERTPTAIRNGPSSNRFPIVSRSSASSRTRRVCPCTSRPSGVRTTPRLSRSSSGDSRMSSISRIWSESAGCETWTLSAARLNEPCSTTALKYRNWRNVTGTSDLRFGASGQ